jgi:hypothetical protein
VRPSLTAQRSGDPQAPSTTPKLVAHPQSHAKLQIQNHKSKIGTILSQFDASKDYYAVLGADDNSSPREIERLYKRLARRHHPDRGGTDDEMKALNEAYRVLREAASRKAYDAGRRRPRAAQPAIQVAPSAREIGVYGQGLSALLCVLLGLLLLFLVRFNGLWFLWPLALLALGVSFFGILMAHSAMSMVLSSLHAAHPARRFPLAREAVFWSVVCGGVYGVYLIFTAI